MIANCHCDDRDCDYNNKMLFLPWIGNQIVGLAVRGAGTVVPVAGADRHAGGDNHCED